jgi:hypothetical protein
MRIDIPQNEKWTSVCESYRAALPFQDPAVQVQVFAGFQHALTEATQGLQRLFSHKKTIAIVTPTEPALEAVAIAFSEDGFTVKNATAEEIANPEWLTSIQNDLLFVLMSEDDPVTGKLNDFATIHAALREKRIFRIILSHASHAITPVTRPHIFEVRVLSLKPEIALVVAGERFRVTPTFASRLPWLDQNPKKDLSLRPSFAAEVIAFEEQLPPGFKAYFKKGEPRVFDRAVIYHPELDGSAVIDQLAETSGDKISAAGTATAFDSSSPCRWNNPRFTDWLISRGLSEEIIRGLIVIDGARVNGLGPSLAHAAKTVMKMQSGN